MTLSRVIFDYRQIQLPVKVFAVVANDAYVVFDLSTSVINSFTPPFETRLILRGYRYFSINTYFYVKV